MAHPLVMALFAQPAAAAAAGRELRTAGIPGERISFVARSHDEEGDLAEASGGTPGSEIEDSRAAGRLGELGAHFLAAVAVVLPGVGPILADGPFAAELGEAAGHIAGGLSRTLQQAGLPDATAEAWERRIEEGDVLVAVHTDQGRVAAVRELLERFGGVDVTTGMWSN